MAPSLNGFKKNQKLIVVGFVSRFGLKNVLLASEFRILNCLEPQVFDLDKIRSLKTRLIPPSVTLLLLALIAIRANILNDSVIIALK